MDLRYVSDGFHLDRKDLFGRDVPIPSWLSSGSQPLFSIDTGDNSAGNGGDGGFVRGPGLTRAAPFPPLHTGPAGPRAPPLPPQNHPARFYPARPPISG